MSDLEDERYRALVDRRGGVAPLQEPMSLVDFRAKISEAMDAAPALPPSAKLAIFSDMLSRFKADRASRLDPKYYEIVVRRTRQNLGLDPITNPKIAAAEYRISVDYQLRGSAAVESAFLTGAVESELDPSEEYTDKERNAYAAGIAFAAATRGLQVPIETELGGEGNPTRHQIGETKP